MSTPAPTRTSVPVRQAVPADAAELVRLRRVMFDSMDGTAARTAAAHGSPQPWQQHAEQLLRTRLADPDGGLVVFVVDRPDGAGALAACAVGTVEQRLPGPGNPSGLVGEVFNVATDPDLRRRGYSRACMTALLDWYREHGVRKIDLRASTEGEPLYASLGFVRNAAPAMRLVW